MHKRASCISLIIVAVFHFISASVHIKKKSMYRCSHTRGESEKSIQNERITKKKRSNRSSRF